jgi:hypothetical protein
MTIILILNYYYLEKIYKYQVNQLKMITNIILNKEENLIKFVNFQNKKIGEKIKYKY